MKKFSILLLILVCVLNLTACSKNSAGTSQTSPNASASVSPDTEPETTAKDDSSTAETEEPSSTKASGNSLEAGLGNLKLYYNNKWTYDKQQSEDASLAFTRGAALIGVTCSQETGYQCPEDMIKTSMNMLESTDGFKVTDEMKSVKVNGEKWCEITYESGTGDAKQINVLRCYGKNYYAYSITYSALESDFKKYKSSAMSILDSCVMDVPDNKAGETKAKNDLEGEWDAGDKGYLVLNKDGTYYWYMDSSKSMDNVHYGTYGCDNKISSMNVTEGHGLYLCLFPEKFFTDGKETDMGTYKIEFAISNSSTTGVDCDYSAVNMSNYNVYYLNRVK